MLVPTRMPNDCPEQSVLGGTLVRRGLGGRMLKGLTSLPETHPVVEKFCTSLGNVL